MYRTGWYPKRKTMESAGWIARKPELLPQVAQQVLLKCQETIIAII
jgi:hypothetical protein